MVPSNIVFISEAQVEATMTSSEHRSSLSQQKRNPTSKKTETEIYRDEKKTVSVEKRLNNKRAAAFGAGGRHCGHIFTRLRKISNVNISKIFLPLYLALTLHVHP